MVLDLSKTFIKNIITLIAVFSTILSYGQKNDPSLRSGQMHSYNPIFSNNTNKFLNPPKLIKGSRFLFENFQEPGIIYSNGKTHKISGLNIDALNHDIVLKIGLDSILILEKNKIDSLKIGNRKFKKVGSNSLYEIVYDDQKFTLLKRHKCHIKKGRTNVMKGTTENDSYKLTNKYFLYQNKTLSNSFELNKKAVVNLFEKQEKQTKKYIRNNKLNIKKEEDFIKLLNQLFYNFK